MACKICEVRRPRRACPGVGGDICPQCCGAERENSVNCPLDCEYLTEAHLREKPLAEEDVPFPDVQVTDNFLENHMNLVTATGSGLATAALGMAGVVDTDVRDALESLVESYKALGSGIYYEGRPTNVLAARIQDLVKKGLEEYRKAEAQQAGMTVVRDSDVLRVLVFMARMERHFNNGRRKGRAFIDFLRSRSAMAAGPAPQASPLIVP
jgi:hypothetical protein